MNKRIRKKKDLKKAVELVSNLKEGEALVMTEERILKVRVQTITLPMVTTITQPIELEGYLSEVIKR